MTRTLNFTLPAGPTPVGLGKKVDRTDLYGRQRTEVQQAGVALEEVTLDSEGRIFETARLSTIAVDTDGALVTRPIIQTIDGEELPDQESSFHVSRQLTPTDEASLACLKVASVYPITCPPELAPGLYQTQFSYRGSPQLEDAIITVAPGRPAFLLVGEFRDLSFQAKSDVYEFFNENIEDDESDDGLSFDMY